MKINKQSIQYKAVNTMFKKPNNNLCVFFWQLVWVGLLLVFAIMMVIGFFVFPYSILYIDLENTSKWVEVFVFLGIISWGSIGAILIVLLCFGLEALTRKFGRKEDSVVGEYIKAKKEKICPRIEFED